MKVILFLLGLLFSADGLYAGATASMGFGEGIVVAVGIMFILLSCSYESFKTKKFLRFIKRAFILFMALLVAYSCSVCVVGGQDNATYDEKYVLVLGAGLDGDKPSAVLESRLEKTVEYMIKNSDAIAVVSGGQGSDEAVAEALVMQVYLINHGIGEERIYIEDNAKSTYQNFEYSQMVIENDSAAVVTNEFHILRAVLMANLNGMQVTHLSAKTPLYMMPIVCAREFFAQIASVRYYFWR